MDRQPRSFFETPTSAPPEEGRLFLVTYHFPPDQAAGALRWEKLARHAAEHGFGLDVLTRDPADLPSADFARLRELPPGVRIFGVREREIAVRRVEHALWRAHRRLSPTRSEAGPVRVAGRPSQKSSYARSELRLELLSPRGWKRAYNGWALYASHRAWARRSARLGRRLWWS